MPKKSEKYILVAITTLTLATLFVGCQTRRKDSSKIESSVQEKRNEYPQQKNVLQNLQSFFEQIGPNIQHHVKYLIKNSPYAKFGSSSGLGLVEESDEAIDFSTIDFNNVSALPVPITSEQIAALTSEDFSSSSFSLSGTSSHGEASSSSPHSEKNGLPGVMKGLYDYMLCNSPVTGIYAFASTDRIPVLGAFSSLSKLAVKIPVASQSKAISLFPALKDPARAVELEIFGGVALHGPNAGFAAKLKGLALWKLAYSEGIEGSLKEGISRIHEVSGLPLAAIPQVFSAAAWNKEEMALFLYQDFVTATVGVKMTFSFEKLAQIGDLNAWRKGRTCSVGHE